MIKLIENEILKMLSKKKLLLISGILLILISLFAYGENHSYKNTINRYTRITGQTQNYDWKSLVNQQISDLKSRLNSPYIRDNNRTSTSIQIEQLQYYLNHNMNPITPSSAKFTIKFMQQAVILFLPLLAIVLAGDNVSGEFSSKTIKVLLTKAVPRWKILLSKYIALLIMTSIVVLETVIISIIVSTLMFHTGGWAEPVATGFRVVSGKLDASNVIKAYEWQYAILVYGLGWFAINTVTTVSFMVSILVRNTSTSIGIMMASLIGGEFLQYFLADWPIVKYFFVINLNLPKYLTGSFQPIEGMTLTFSVLVLCVWSILALVVSFKVFNTQDVLV
ncbi:ABC transporter permease [Clostridiaceae bacterium UIB06]|uniref:ABC transporter permease n=1 Tax=Clostridium thailandense TaxID=2794346 RepID=A0A949TV73_9CLOT|nr:ABC transporter permease [Clostridium thailandense]MBV7272035.1 ABC transporter permease [Clostridium thailandense]MCH5137433.1 ABC transporter permease [Clostridiaceae bacterium UIB06]